MDTKDFVKISRIKIFYGVIAMLIPVVICWPVDIFVTIAAFLVMFCILLFAHVANDFYDFKNGTDSLNVKEKDLIGEQKPLVSGRVSMSEAKLIMFSLLAISLVAAIYLLYVQLSVSVDAVLIVLALGVATVIIGYSYSGKPIQFSYHGCGEFVLVWCGGTAPCIIPYYLYTHSFSIAITVIGVGLGLIFASVLTRSQLIDVDSDLATNRMTLTARLYKRNGKAVVDAAHIGIFSFGLLFVCIGMTLYMSAIFYMAMLFWIFILMLLPELHYYSQTDMVKARMQVFYDYAFIVLITAFAFLLWRYSG